MDKRRLIVGGILIAVLVVGIIAGVIYYSTNTHARNQLLTQLDITPASGAGGLKASGFIEAEQIEIAAEMGGRVVELPFQEGDEVAKGDMIVRLDTALLEAQRDIAKAQLEMIIAQRDLIKATPRQEVIRQAEAQVVAAQAAADGSKQAWYDAIAIRNNPQDIQLQVADAETQVAVAQHQFTVAQVQLTMAERSQEIYYSTLDTLADLQERFPDKNFWLPWEVTFSPQNYQEAWISFNSSHETLQGAQALLDSLVALANDPQALQARVIDAEAAFHAAEAALERAQAQLADLEAGPSKEQLAAADARVQEARAALKAIDVQIEHFTIDAPIGGVVLDQPIHVGELAVPGATIVTLANLDTVELTVYIPETQFDKVYLTQKVSVSVDSFPDRTFEGVVVHIADEAEFTPRNVQTHDERVNLVYAIKIRLDNPGHALKPGMPADAIFE